MPDPSNAESGVVRYANGNLKHRGRHLEGEMHGSWEFYRLDGTLMRAGSFDRGRQVGVWRTYDRSGRVVKENEIRMMEAEIIERAPQPTAAIRLSQPMAELDLAAAFDHGMPLVASRITESGGSITGPPYARYHQFGPDVVNVEIGFLVGDAPDLPALSDVPSGEVGRSELPGGPAAKAMHWGPYDGLAATYDALHEWIHGRPGYDDGPGPWESYVNSPSDTTDMSQLRTEIVWPLVRG